MKVKRESRKHIWTEEIRKKQKMHKEKYNQRKNKLINAKNNSIASEVCYTHNAEARHLAFRPGDMTATPYPSVILQNTHTKKNS
jgi:hypothetical protein